MSSTPWLRAVGLGGLMIVLAFVCLFVLTAPAAESEDPEPPNHDRFSNSIGMKFVRVKAGKFMMGVKENEKDAEDDEWPRHEVEITKAFYLGVYEVTQKQYKEVMGKNPSAFRKGGSADDAVQGLDTSDFPVENVSWNDARAFLKKLNATAAEKKAKLTYRLPTEAEWEYACRGGHLIRRLGKKAELRYHLEQPTNSLGFGDANFDTEQPYGDGKKGEALERTCKVGSYEPNALGIYDMHGNVDEWCHDWYDDEYYDNSPRKDPRGPARGEERVTRGGNWDETGKDCRASARFPARPGDREFILGFRVVAVPSGK